LTSCGRKSEQKHSLDLEKVLFKEKEDGHSRKSRGSKARNKEKVGGKNVQEDKNKKTRMKYRT